MTWGLLGIAVTVVGLVAVLVRAPNWYRLWVLVSIGAIVATAAIGVVIIVLTSDDPDAQFCADEGVVTETRGSTPEEALAAYVASVGGDPADWELDGRVFRPVDASAQPSGKQSLVAAEVEPGVWRVVGTCVDVGREP